MAGCVLRIITRLNRGGPLRQLCALVPGLAALGWEGPVIAGRTASHEPEGSADLEALGARVVRLPSLQRGIDPAADARALRGILGWIRRTKPDVVHTHMGKAGALGRTAARIARVPAVHTFHGHHLQAPWPRDRLACAAERVLAPWTAAAICLTPRQRRDLCEIHRPLHATKVEVIGPGLDVAAVRRGADAATVQSIRARWRTDDLPLFVWAGRFVEVKDPHALVRAVQGSAQRFRLVMLGDGPLRASVEREIHELGVGGTVHCAGAVEETAPWIAACDGVVLSSRSEGAPMLIVEAKILGRLAIATAVGGVPDLVRHGVDGWWVPPGSCHDLARALDTLAADGALRQRLGAAAAAGADQRFSAERLATSTAELYERVRRSGRGRNRR